MAITRRKEDNLVETKLVNKKIDDIKTKVKENPNLDKIKPKSRAKTKNTGFLQTTWAELKKVQWPSPRYTVNWSIIILVFTFLISISLGAFDHLFTGSIRFVNCTSPQNENKPVQECVQNFANYITFRDNN